VVEAGGAARSGAFAAARDADFFSTLQHARAEFAEGLAGDGGAA
jgi:hypothetical protein